jgi:hypothetical protein
MSTLRMLTAAIAAATASLAFAQATPPTTATDPAVGAGQRSAQETPMGTTGTPGGTGAAAQSSTAGSTAGSSATTTPSSEAAAAADTGTGKKKVKADRN